MESYSGNRFAATAETLCRIRRDQGIDHGIDLPVHKRIQRIERKPDSVISHSALREIIGANAFASVARADLSAALVCDLGIAPCLFDS
jgi:hypothetical protein